MQFEFDHYTDAIAAVSCPECPLRAICEEYWEQNVRPEIVPGDLVSLIKDLQEDPDESVADSMYDIHTETVALHESGSPGQYGWYGEDSDGNLQFTHMVSDRGRQDIPEEVRHEADFRPEAKAVAGCLRRIATNGCVQTAQNAAARPASQDLFGVVQPNMASAMNVIDTMARFGSDAEVFAFVARLDRAMIGHIERDELDAGAARAKLMDLADAYRAFQAVKQTRDGD